MSTTAPDNTPTPRTDELEQAVPESADTCIYFNDAAELCRKLERELAAAKKRDKEARELLGEIRDNEVDPADEADKFLRDHKPSELSILRAQLAAIKLSSVAPSSDWRVIAEELAEALDESSNLWQMVSYYYGPDNLCLEAELKSLAVRDTALAKFRDAKEGK